MSYASAFPQAFANRQNNSNQGFAPYQGGGRTGAFRGSQSAAYNGQPDMGYQQQLGRPQNFNEMRAKLQAAQPQQKRAYSQGMAHRIGQMQQGMNPAFSRNQNLGRMQQGFGQNNMGVLSRYRQAMQKGNPAQQRPGPYTTPVEPPNPNYASVQAQRPQQRPPVQQNAFSRSGSGGGSIQPINPQVRMR